MPRLELDRTLARDPGVEVTLVNRENFFLFTLMLHEVAASDLDLTDAEVVQNLRGLHPSYLAEIERLVRAAEEEKNQEDW